jgi:Uma2 family endonuclease
MEAPWRFDLVDGKLVEKGMGQISARVCSRAFRLLANHVEEHHLGEVYGADNGYQAFPFAPRRVRYPDLSFIHRDHLSPDGPVPGHCRIVPDLTGEVVSPNDGAEEINARVADFLRAGTRLAWVIYPESRWVAIFRGDGTGGWRTEEQELEGEAVVPGFRVRVAELFRDLPRRPVPTVGGETT